MTSFSTLKSVYKFILEFIIKRFSFVLFVTKQGVFKTLMFGNQFKQEIVIIKVMHALEMYRH